MDFKDLVRSEIEQHMLDYHKEVKKAMRQVCYVGHALSSPGGACEAGHGQGISLKCQVENCIFATKPVPIGFMGIANQRLERHTSASHPSIKTVKTDESEKKDVDSEDPIVQMDMVESREFEEHADIKVKDTQPKKEGLKVNKPRDKRSCEVCFKVFYSMGNMKAHVKSHHDAVGRFDCDNCERSFGSKIALQYHLKRIHSNGAEITCETCDDKFSDFESYSIHRKTHRSVHFQLEHKCSECSKII